MEASRADRRPRTRKSLRLLKRTVDPAFEQLYRKHAREVYQYALALLTNPADAEDATQTTFLNAYRAYQRGERPNKPHNWLITITHNVCRMRWRQAGSRPREVAFDEAPEPVALEHERPNLDEVLAALARLTFNQRSALVMRELEGRSYQEIAGVLDLSVGAVEALLFRARRRLQLERKALGVLSTAPLPGSLTSFLGAGGGAVAGGGAAIGADLVLKAAAVVVAGAVTAGVGFKSVEAISSPATPPAAQAKAPLLPTGQNSAPAGHAQPVRRTAKARTAKRRSATPVTGVTRYIEPSAAGNVASPTQDASPLPPPIGSTVSTVTTAVGVTIPVPVPPAPVLPPPPVTVPTVPTVPPLPPPPPLPITVTTPTLPPPPIK
jgi:RNA polymerase sigma factor (sigma-70 family)